MVERSQSTLRRRMPSAKAPSQILGARLSQRRFDSESGITPMDRNLAGVTITDEETDAILQQLANEDDDARKTWSRLLVENYLSKYSWYFPGKDVPGGPSLSKAWAYYEHVTLPRHHVGDGATDTVMRRAEPGEHETETELYEWISMKQSVLIEWGTGIDLYFISLKFFALLMLICGLINLPGIRHYASGDYNGYNPQEYKYQSVLQGSAVCNHTEWVVCTDCEGKDWDRDPTRFANGLSETGSATVLVLRNLCEGATAETGYSNFTTLVFVLVSIAVFSYYLRAREIRFDEDKVTTTDYSVEVTNPPPEALDPDEWKNFFSQFATNGDQVTAVTIALNNDVLVRKLLSRRIFRDQLKDKLPGVDLDNRDAVVAAIMKFNEDKAMQDGGCIDFTLDNIIVPLCNILNMLLSPEDLVKKIDTLTEEIKTLQDKEYHATRVYVTFETEEGQRTALEAMNVGLIDLTMNRTGAVTPECVFRDRVLWVQEPPEPDAVRWLDLSYSFISKIIRRSIALGVTLSMIAIAGYAINAARNSLGVLFSGFLTTMFNSTIPQVIKWLMAIEPHASEGAFQASLYLKITLFRWTLSAMLAQIITPVTATLGYGDTDLLPTTFAILLSDVWLSPLLRLSDWMTNLKKHVLAPRATTQEQMNRNFQGTFYNLGERYTDFTKVLFVVFFYSALFPVGFFFGFVILTFQYLTDKFSLVRIWGWTPGIGSELAVFSRRFFFTGAAIALCVVSAYAFAQFPYDNICDALEPESGFSGVYTNVTHANGDPVLGWDGETAVDSLYVSYDNNAVFCNQAFHAYNGFSFPPTPRIQTNDPSLTARPDENDLTWMTDAQEDITTIYGWFAFVLAIIFVVVVFGNTVYTAVVSVFMGTYQPEGAVQHIDFSSNPEIFCYVPQIKLIGHPFPFLVCDIDDIDQGLIGWNNPAHSYDYHNLIFEIPHKSLRRTVTLDDNTRGTTTIASQLELLNSGRGYTVNEKAANERPIYSIVRHYPTAWQIMLAEAEAASNDQSG
eukprot:Nitzschia sp. Nitz4//scaffold174_size87051//32646//36062//NITZ4_005106-RA/size87051-snap-gene-0.111-mRNA-1//-1//CDS//3329538863//3032//frame0